MKWEGMAGRTEEEEGPLGLVPTPASRGQLRAGTHPGTRPGLGLALQLRGWVAHRSLEAAHTGRGARLTDT